MIKLNVIARVDKDKNSFGDLLYALHQLKQEQITQVNILFVGPIGNESLYFETLALAQHLGISSNISFTKKAILIDDLSEDIKSGYFVNFTIADFMGYSALEAIKNNLKAIFYNADSQYIESIKDKPINLCADLKEFISLIKRLISEKPAVDAEIIKSNERLKDTFRLSNNDKRTLLSFIKP
ncbi:hypothetical protein [Mucilaginibacter segetis]|uniref:Uncharacterized protein n=1 Tax=Mucilaginibacter segetis TaxID=2793071 RepID=A0A934PS51_9SPHI|nr:hypothetical protein [Mucilaginibacter segetis]MBK0378206.1 hypothetical protein [Mucilaginibacter segetis]